jgi:hypothetical protein
MQTEESPAGMSALSLPEMRTTQSRADETFVPKPLDMAE